jgi:uncharacterized protein YceK
MLRRTLATLVAAAALAMAGCGTMSNQSEYNWFPVDHPHTSNRMFGGVRVDAEAVAGHYYKELWAGDRDPSAQTLLLPVAVFLPDLALCLAADTLLLPYDLWATAAGRATTTPPVRPASPSVTEQTDDAPPAG